MASALAFLAERLGLFQNLQLPLAAAAVATAFAAPRFVAGALAGPERVLRALGARPILAMILLALGALAVRAALIPFIGGAEPVTADEASLILQAGTLAHGRLDNPPLSPDFESVFVILRPAYASMYPVLRSLPMTLGRLVAGDDWLGVLASMAALCAGSFYMLRAWVSGGLAMAGALLVLLTLGLFSFWVNSYFGAAFTALGGVLLLGGYRRAAARPTLAAGCAIGAGVLILMTTRPFEALMFAAPFGAALAWACLTAPTADRWRWARAGATAAVFVGAGVALTVAHDAAVTGDWRLAPYTLYRQTTAQTQPFMFQGLLAHPPSRYFSTRWFLDREALVMPARSWLTNLARAQTTRWAMYWNFYLGFALTAPFLVGCWALRREWPLLAAGATLAAGLAVESFQLSYYAAPAFGLILLAVVRGLGVMRRWAPGGRPVGRALAALLALTPCVALAAPLWSSLTGQPPFDHFDGSLTQPCCWIRPRSIHLSAQRVVGRTSERAIVIVDTGPAAPRSHVIVFNDADPAAARTIWLNRDDELNPATLARYPGRAIWRLSWLSDRSACLTSDAASPADGPGASVDGWSPSPTSGCPSGWRHDPWPEFR